MSDPLREKLIRLAHAQPELRDDLLPLLKQAETARTAGVHYWARIEDVQKEYLQQTTDTLIRLLGPGWDGQQLRRGALVRRTTGEPVYFNLDFYHPDGRVKPEIRVQGPRTSGVPDFGAVVDSSDQSAKEIAKQLKKAL